MRPFALTDKERQARAVSDLRIGLPVVLEAGGARALILAAEGVWPARYAEMRALGPTDLAITAHRAATLKVQVYDKDLARIALRDSSDLRWVTAVADPAEDLAHPLKGPFRVRRGGPAALHRAAIALCKAAQLLPAALVLPDPPADLPADLTRLAADKIDTGPPWLGLVSAARVPIAGASNTRLSVFRAGVSREEHYLIEIGRVDRAQPVLVRLHSACFTGDVLGSLKCDCGPQLHAAMAAMTAAGSGILLYLNQEGRGIGLANKMRAYALQDQGFDTVEANHRLGFEDDERDFRIGSEMLRTAGVASVRLMTNNPAKMARLEAQGIGVVERVPLRVGEGPENAAYLATKTLKSGHLR
ncbi:MAG: GTP cyclohydrolase II [Pseudomonadota bacterium]